MNMAVDDEQTSSAEAVAQNGRKRRQSRLMWLGGGALVLAALGYSFYWAGIGRYQEETDDAYVRADWITISPKVSGYVFEVLVEDNQSVTAGTPLVRIQDRDYQARLHQARARQAEA